MEVELESPQQLATRIGWPVGRIRKLISEEKLRHYRFGRSVMIPPTAIAEYLESTEVKPNTGSGSDAK